MDRLLSLAGSLAAIAGILLCLIAGAGRLGGNYHLAGFEATTLFAVGTGLMVFACLARLEQLAKAARG